MALQDPIFIVRPRAIAFCSFSKPQIRAIEEMNQGIILAAWSVGAEHFVALDCQAPNLFVWQDRTWKEVG